MGLAVEDDGWRGYDYNEVCELAAEFGFTAQRRGRSEEVATLVSKLCCGLDRSSPAIAEPNLRWYGRCG